MKNPICVKSLCDYWIVVELIKNLKMDTINTIREVLAFVCLCDMTVVLTLVTILLVLFFAALFVDDKDSRKYDQGSIHDLC